MLIVGTRWILKGRRIGACCNMRNRPPHSRRNTILILVMIDVLGLLASVETAADLKPASATCLVSWREWKSPVDFERPQNVGKPFVE